MKNVEESGSIKEPVIVVSDVHLGGEKSNGEEFHDFLTWLTMLPVDGQTFNCDGEELTIQKPGTMVLLGDILELWDPEDDDRNNVLTDVLAPLITLNSLGCDIIYVIGNHDEDLLDFKHAWRNKTVDFPQKGSFDIVFRSYPRKIAGTEKIEGVVIGNWTYVFLHGQQFDNIQFFYKISKFLSEKLKRQVRIDPIDWHQDLANVSFIRNVGKKSWNTLLFGILLSIYISWYIFWFKDANIGSGWGILWGLIWLIISAFFVVTLIPKVVTWGSTKIWKLVLRTKKCASVQEVISDRYKMDKGENIVADIIVFGHTHNAGAFYSPERRKGFINTGCWVRECAEEKRNTFLYLDIAVPHLLTWDKEKVANGELTCVEDLSKVLRT